MKHCAVKVQLESGVEYFNSEIDVTSGDEVAVNGKTGVVLETLDWLDIEGFPLIDRVSDDFVPPYGEIEAAIRAAAQDALPSPQKENAPRERHVMRTEDFEIDDGTLVAYRGKDAFVRIPDGVTVISEGAFRDNAFYLKSVVIPKSLKRICGRAFHLAVSLWEVIFEGVPEEIGSEAFGDSDALCAVFLPEGIKTLGKEVFPYATHIFVKERSRPRGWDKNWHDGHTVEYGCDKRLFVEDGLVYLVAEGVGETLTLSQTDEVTLACAAAPMKELVVPSIVRGKRVVGVNTGAFEGSKATESVVLPEGMDFIGENAFRGCLNLQTISLPASLGVIHENAFLYSGLRSILLPAGVTLHDSCFSHCKQLERAVIGEGTKVIPQSAFENCESLASVILPSSVERVESAAFRGCTNLFDFIVHGTPAFSRDALGFDALRLSKKGGLRYLGCAEQPFGVCLDRDAPRAEREEVNEAGVYVVPDDLSALPENFAEENPDVKKLVLGKNLSAFDAGDFIRPNGEELEVEVPSGCRHIRYEGDNLLNVTSGVLIRGGKKGVLPKGLKEIGPFAFLNRKKIKEYSFEEGLEKIGYGAFSRSGIQSLVLPASVTYVDDHAFSDTPSFTAPIRFKGTRAQWDAAIQSSVQKTVVCEGEDDPALRTVEVKVVSVKFEDGKKFMFNCPYTVRVGDRVRVSGPYEKKTGTVLTVEDRWTYKKTANAVTKIIR